MSSANFAIVGLGFFIITCIVYCLKKVYEKDGDEYTTHFLEHVMLTTCVISGMFMVPFLVDITKPLMILWVDY